MSIFPLQWQTQNLRPLPFPNPLLCSKLSVSLNATTTSSSSSLKQNGAKAILTLEQLTPNALRRRRDPQWRGGFSIGLDLGLARTGLALGKGFAVRPLTVLELRGQKLEVQLLKIAEQEEADEFSVGLPKSSDGKETPLPNEVRSIAGRLAVRAAERWYRRDISTCQVRVLNLYSPRILICKKNFKGVLPKTLISLMNLRAEE